MSSEPGDPAPDLQLIDLSGAIVSLSEVWHRSAYTLLVFLRHLG